MVYLILFFIILLIMFYMYIIKQENNLVEFEMLDLGINRVGAK